MRDVNMKFGGNKNVSQRLKRVKSYHLSRSKLLFEHTDTTPFINFDAFFGRLEILGKSTCENPLKFYTDVFEALENYDPNLNIGFTADIKLTYFNTSSAKCLYDMIRLLRRIQESGKTLVVNWFYEQGDEDMLESGEDFSDTLGVPFFYHEVDVIA